MKTPSKNEMFLGIDIGSVALKLALLDGSGALLRGRYARLRGAPLEAALEALEALEAEGALAQIQAVAITGSGAAALGELWALPLVNEVIAHASATAQLCPQARSIIEIGGEDSKLILLEPSSHADGRPAIKDLAMNSLCAAGTGSFLEQQAARLGVAIEKEWGELAMRSTRPPRIAGRCSVFAKSDMIHLQQQSVPDYDIIAGLCFAMARNFQAVVCAGKEISAPVCFQGGVAGNAGMRRAFEEVLKLRPGELIVPEHYAIMGAIGAVLEGRRSGKCGAAGPQILNALRQHLKADRRKSDAVFPPLADSGYKLHITPDPLPQSEDELRVFIGVDVGSISTNVVAIDEAGRVLAREYLMTAGRPLRAITEGLFLVGRALDEKRGGRPLLVCGCGTTGSGRYLTGDFIGADIVKNEITAHAEGAMHARPDVDTIFEIGGQDSKYIALEKGAVIDFAMNKVCAAGTGSFIEEQSERLDVRLKNGDFNRLALASKTPLVMGDRCTVFIETEINRRVQRGASVPDLCAGLCYSIAQNYLNRVVEKRRIGNVILFQGGTAYNRGVKAAFEQLLGKPIIVPPHHDILGAIGMALLAQKAWDGKSKSAFKGFDLRARTYETSAFECADCANRCEVRVVSVKGENPLYYGGRCGKFDETRRHRPGRNLPRLFAERNRLLEKKLAEIKQNAAANRPSVGLARATNLWEFLPFFAALFHELGFEPVLSDPTTPDIVAAGTAATASEPCFPIKTAHGHVCNLMAKKTDYICLPVIVDMPRGSEKFVNSYVCPYVQTFPFLAQAAMPGFDWQRRLIRPILHFSRGTPALAKALLHALRRFNIASGQIRNALEKALETQAEFRAALRRRGAEMLENLPAAHPAVVILSRPYNGCDPGLNIGIPEKFRDLGCLALPMEMLPLEENNVSDDYPDMYWNYGQRILAAARIIARDPRLHPVYITNFGCGPDSFILKYVERELRGKPCLVLEVDEHSSDVGILTRCEAFLDSIRSTSGRPAAPRQPHRTARVSAQAKDKRTVFIPYMDDHGAAIAAALRACGTDSCMMPVSDSRSIALGRKCTSGKECYPCILTLGDMLRQASSPGFNPARSAFFMATTSGPCRFGQYQRFQRMALDEAGLEEVPLVLLDQDANYRNHLKNLGEKFRSLAWAGVIFIDAIQRLLRQTRPYELHKGDCDALYLEMLANCEKALAAGRLPADALAEAAAKFLAVPVDRSVPKPRIGIVGEIFVRCNPFANNFIARKIEELGAEVELPPLQEWVNYIQHNRIADTLIKRRFLRFAMEKLVAFASAAEKKFMLRKLSPELRRMFQDADMKEILSTARRYLDPALRGEAVLSMARSIEYANNSCAGVVNLAPFNCMPGTVVNALLARFQQDYDMPVLKIMHDGIEQASEATRLEAFVHQCSNRLCRRATD